MKEKEIALVLKRFLPSKQTISVFSLSMGKITVAIKNRKICNTVWGGMLISFHPEENNGFYSCEEVEIIHLPPTNYGDDLSWLHHLLELCYYSLPSQQVLPDIFQYLCCYLAILNHRHEVTKHMKIIQKLCILHFLQKMGAHLEKKILKYSALLENMLIQIKDNTNPQIFEEITQELEKMQTKDINFLEENILRELRSHPCYRQFKTMRFSYKL